MLDNLIVTEMGLGSAIARGRYSCSYASNPNPISNPIHNRRGLAIAALSYGGP